MAIKFSPKSSYTIKYNHRSISRKVHTVSWAEYLRTRGRQYSEYINCKKDYMFSDDMTRKNLLDFYCRNRSLQYGDY